MFEIRIPTINEIRREVENRVINPAVNTVRQVGEASRSGMGSLGYINPLTAPFQLVADYYNQEDKKKAAEAEADAARERYNQSTNLADQVRNRQGLFASELKKNAFRDYGLLSNQAAANERRALAERLNENKTSMSRRGLLNSGISSSNKAMAAAEAAANTASKQKQIQDLLNQQITDAEDLQAQLGLEMGGISQSMSDQYYRMALENMQNRNAAFNSILRAGGTAAGAYLGRNGYGEG